MLTAVGKDRYESPFVTFGLSKYALIVMTKTMKVGRLKPGRVRGRHFRTAPLRSLGRERACADPIGAGH